MYRFGILLITTLCFCAQLGAMPVALQDCADRYAGRICRGEPIDSAQLKEDLDSVEKVIFQDTAFVGELDEHDLQAMNSYFYDENNGFHLQAVQAFQEVNLQALPQEKALLRQLVTMVCALLH